MINKVILVGNLGQDPEIRHLESGSVVGRFSVATNETYRDKNGEYQTITEWHNVVVWRYLAERAEKYLGKGKLVYVEGKLTHRKYQDQNGVEKNITEVVASNLRILERREDANRLSGGGAPMPTQEPQTMSQPQPAAQPQQSAAPKTNVAPETPFTDEDDLPF